MTTRPSPTRPFTTIRRRAIRASATTETTAATETTPAPEAAPTTETPR
ncbi:hypothetical protein G3I43_25990 [Streptomyces anulatus]|uniref:Uncharacterized protein n=1 Tax=Streptomyces anulatus TaxID=1892 RepID=A0A6G3SY61_STRAQ|nr:hypothetical protein [Streptomyces anulatus]